MIATPRKTCGPAKSVEIGERLGNAHATESKREKPNPPPTASGDQAASRLLQSGRHELADAGDKAEVPIAKASCAANVGEEERHQI